MSPAWISGIAGRAIIVDDLVHGDAKYFRLAANTEDPPEPCGPRHLRNFLSFSPDVEVIDDPGPPPYRAVQAELDRVTRQESALKLGLMALDERLPDDLRTDVARQAEALLEDESTHEAVRHRLLSVPLPGVADFSKLPEVGQLTTLFETARDSAPLVERISTAWTVAAYRFVSRGLSPLDGTFLEDTLKPACTFHGGFAALVDAIRSEDPSIYESWLRGVAELPPFNKPDAIPFLREWEREATPDSERLRRFAAWLSSASWSLEDVEALKKRHTKQDEAYRSLQEMIHLEIDVESLLAALALELIAKTPDLISFGRAPDRLQLHLVELCGELPANPRLATPLLAAWYQRHERRMSGKELTNPLNQLAEALDKALTQIIDYQFLRKAWNELCRDTPGGIFIEAIPNAREVLSTSFPEVLGKILAITTHILTPCPRRRPLFQTYTAKLTKCWPEEGAKWEERLIRLADRNQLSRWAVESLPSLFVPLPSTSSRYERLLLWNVFQSFLPQSGKGKRWLDHGSICCGLVLEVEVSKNLFDHLQQVSDIFEDKRKNLPHGSDQAMEGVIVDAMADLEAMMTSKNKRSRPLSDRARTALATAAKDGRSRILRQNYPICTKSNDYVKRVHGRRCLNSSSRLI